MAEERSFSGRVKDELAHVHPELACCQRMELAALVRACGNITLSGHNRLSVVLTTDHAPVARKIIRLTKAQFGLATEVLVMRRRRLRKNLKYVVRIPPQQGLTEMLHAVGVLDENGHLHDWGDLDLLANDHCRRAYLRGIFLGTGWVSSPERQHHLEMTITTTEAADQVGQLLFRYGIPVRAAFRKGVMMLYIKDAEHISRFLGLVGAHEAMLHYESVRALKDVKNRINRQVNAETANLNKTVEASARQVEALQRLQASGRLDGLSRPLQELAMLRLKHPDASLKELGQMCNPPVGKSGINHRMRQLMRLAESEEPSP